MFPPQFFFNSGSRVVASIWNNTTVPLSFNSPWKTNNGISKWKDVIVFEISKITMRESGRPKKAKLLERQQMKKWRCHEQTWHNSTPTKILKQWLQGKAGSLPLFILLFSPVPIYPPRTLFHIPAPHHHTVVNAHEFFLLLFPFLLNPFSLTPTPTPRFLSTLGHSGPS